MKQETDNVAAITTCAIRFLHEKGPDVVGLMRDVSKINVHPLRIVLQGYSKLLLEANEVMEVLNFCCLEDLYSATISLGLALPSISHEHASILADRVIRLLQGKDHA